MRPIRLPEPPIGRRSAPEVFEAGIYGVIKRVVVIGNGFSGAENQCIGLVRALGLSGCHTLYVSFSLSLPFSLFISKFSSFSLIYMSQDSN